MSATTMRLAGWSAALVAAAVLAAPAMAQTRLSLSERVARLEQQMQGQGSGQSTVELLNRLDALQAEVQDLRGQLEQQAYEVENLKKQQRDRYIDLDARLSRLEGGAAPAAAAADLAPTAPPPVAPSDAPGQLTPDELAPATSPADVAAAPEAGATPALAPSSDPADERAAYDEALGALLDGRYAESARRFAAFLQQYPDGDYADNATYWLGESYYVTQNYQVALETFQDLLARFPDSSKAPDALLKVGYSHYELKDWPQAEAVLGQVVERYPDTTAARLAQGRLRALRLEGQR
jgi:tol-pal system protein YbgF